MPILRMQPDVQNQGYAAGTAAAMAIKAGVPVRRVDIRALQRHLIEMKILPETVLDMEDSFPLPDACFTEAVAAIPNGYQGLSVVLTDPARSVPLLKAAYTAARAPEARLAYAHVLGMMGHPDGETELIARVQGMAWDKGWHFRGMGQFNRSVSWLDSYLIALGRCRSAGGAPRFWTRRRPDGGRRLSFRAVLERRRSAIRGPPFGTALAGGIGVTHPYGTNSGFATESEATGRSDVC